MKYRGFEEVCSGYPKSCCDPLSECFFCPYKDGKLDHDEVDSFMNNPNITGKRADTI